MMITKSYALIVTGSGFLQNGLLALATAVPEIEVVGEASNATVALGMIGEHRPDLVLLDTDLPGDDEWTVLKGIKAQWSQVRCIVLTDDVQQLRQAEAFGADVVMLKGTHPAKLIAAIERLLTQR